MTVNRKTRSDDKPEIPFSALLESEDWISMGITAGLTRREAQVLHCALDDERDAVIATRLTIRGVSMRSEQLVVQCRSARALFAFLVLATLLLTAHRLPGQGVVHTIVGHITTAPPARDVSAATVIVTRGPDRKVFRTEADSAGRFKITIDSGTGDYLVYAAAPVGGDRLIDSRVRLTVPSDKDTILVVNFVLAPQPPQAIAAVRVQATATPPRRDDRTQIGTGIGGNDQQVYGNLSLVPLSDRIDITTLFGSLPGVAMTPSGLSVGGLPPSGNGLVLNGLNFNGASVPTGARTTLSAATSVYDPASGGFSGLEQSIVIPTGALDISTTVSGARTQTAGGLADPAGVQGGRNPVSSIGIGGEGPFARYLGRYNGGIDLVRRENTPLALSELSPASLSAFGLSADSVRRLRQAAAGLGLPDGASEIRNAAGSETVTGVLRLNTADFNYDKGGWLSSSVGVLALISSANALVQPGPYRLGSTAVRSGNQSSSVQLFGSWFLAPTRLLEVRTGYSSNTRTSTPILSVPAANVRSTVSDSIGERGDAILGVGGSGQVGGRRQQETWQTQADLRWSSITAPKHNFRATLDLRADTRRSEPTGAGAGTFEFNSITDFENGRPSAYSLVAPSRGERVQALAAAISLGDRMRVAQRLTLLFGARIDAAEFTSQPAPNAIAVNSFGTNTARLPTQLEVSPRFGFSWQFGAKPTSAARTSTEYADISVPATMVLRGGIGQFVGTLPFDLAASAAANPGLAVAGADIRCLDTASPIPDWSGYLSGRVAAPHSCRAGALPTLSDVAPRIVTIDPSFRAPRSWRSNLSWTIGGQRWNTSMDMDVSFNRQQTSVTDLNFANRMEFVTSDEGRRVFAPASAISPTTGGVPTTAARRTAAFGSVLSYQSDMQSFGTRLTVAAQRFLRFDAVHPMFLEVAYTNSSAASQQRGFDGVSGASPVDAQWGRSSYERKHMLVGRVSVGGKYVNAELAVHASSGLPFTPMIGGDVNGDGRWNDPAFIADPASLVPSSFKSDLTRVLARVGPEIRRCLEGQFGRLAARNSCTSPWSSDMNLRFSLQRSADRRFDRLWDLSLSFVNVLAGLDHALHGSRLAGWGATGEVDPVLFFPSSFNATTQRFGYTVNSGFGDVGRSNNASLNPMRVIVSVRYSLAQNYNVQEMERSLRPGRLGGSGSRVPEEVLFVRYQRNGMNPYQAILALSDSLLLTTTQLRSLVEAQAEWRAREDVYWHELARVFAAMPEDFNAEEAVRIQETIKAEVRENVRLDLQARLPGILSPLQRGLMPSWVRYWLELKTPVKPVL